MEVISNSAALSDQASDHFVSAKVSICESSRVSRLDQRAGCFGHGQNI